MNDFKTSCVNFFKLYLGKIMKVQDTNLTFTPEELEALNNNRFFEVKHFATQKVLHLLGELEKELMKKMNDFSFLSLPELQVKDAGKIFRGENHRMFPYVILDCPRVFSTETIFAFRSMFWWGNEFSFTLHLQGRALDLFREKIQHSISTLQHSDFFICVNNNPWEYSFDEKNYRSLDTMFQSNEDELREMILQKEFLKFSQRLDLNDYSQLVSFGANAFERLMKILG